MKNLKTNPFEKLVADLQKLLQVGLKLNEPLVNLVITDELTSLNKRLKAIVERHPK